MSIAGIGELSKFYTQTYMKRQKESAEFLSKFKKIMKLPKKKKITVSKMKNDAWEQFSRWVRLHEADANGMVKCVTCPKVAHWKTMQAGHFIPGRHNSILFDERGCHSQCYACNCGWLKGNPRKYNKYMLEVYGQDVIDELEALDTVNKQFKVYELEAIFEAYRDLNRQLLEEKI